MPLYFKIFVCTFTNHLPRTGLNTAWLARHPLGTDCRSCGVTALGWWLQQQSVCQFWLAVPPSITVLPVHCIAVLMGNLLPGAAPLLCSPLGTQGDDCGARINTRKRNNAGIIRKHPGRGWCFPVPFGICLLIVVQL